MKHPLTRALHSAGLRPADIAARLAVDPKTVERWLAGRVPYPRHRAALLKLTGWQARDLWPQLAPPATSETAADEIRVIYPNRAAVPVDAWHRLFAAATREISIIAYSGLFLAEDAAILRLLRDKARAGVRVRIALGDPTGRHAAQRGSEEGIHDILATRIHHALILYRPVVDEPGLCLRLHDTVLYNSIYRADDQLLVNTHTHGCPASHAPVLHLHRRHTEGMAATYLEAFERIWAAARDPEPAAPARRR
ncbi:XRE family transcriptional regulator [Natronosporangium hydrolyticum]|uniref:XRE family transcriptional regulator n=1 Tax=Natronosporangium hydrolyticum TaxID=2811111 RepID=A0A895Y8H8_9ACTN|nr:XRE family transcriptional regulator [Natronosporangium hydrolyticum]QSB14034.1 XRE family transcriptional regulator [Natronosporangium hydrolyticum]